MGPPGLPPGVDHGAPGPGVKQSRAEFAEWRSDVCCRLKEARGLDPVGPGAASPGVCTEALSSGQALAAGPHALCLGDGGAQEAQVVRSQARCAEGAWASELTLKAVPGRLQLLPGLLGVQKGTYWVSCDKSLPQPA